MLYYNVHLSAKHIFSPYSLTYNRFPSKRTKRLQMRNGNRSLCALRSAKIIRLPAVHTHEYLCVDSTKLEVHGIRTVGIYVSML